MNPALKSAALGNGTQQADSLSHQRVASKQELIARPSQPAASLGIQDSVAPHKPLRVMKFGGTSVGDASCIQKVIGIILSAVQKSDVVVVVSAMSGVTNKLLEAGVRAEAGDGQCVTEIFDDLRTLHFTAVNLLLTSRESRRTITDKLESILSSGEQLCHDTLRLRKLTMQIQDAISSVGERLSAILVAAALSEYDLAGEAVDAVELIVTDSNHGAAEPQMELTRQRSNVRLRPLLQQSIIPVVTGFIGATTDGVLTTLGRGGSDYSATILAAALEAHEVIIWTDVDGVLTGDPQLVSDATSISELSYREAAELARYGAKVLHPKTMNPVMQSGIPIGIRNTFAPHRLGTKVSPFPPPSNGGVRAVAALRNVALIRLGGSSLTSASEVLDRALSSLAAVRAELLLVSCPSSQHDFSFVVPATVAKAATDALLSEFSIELTSETLRHITMDTAVTLIAMVGERLLEVPEVVGRMVQVLGREKIDILVVAPGSSNSNITFLVPEMETKAALAAAHREFCTHSANAHVDSQTLVHRQTSTAVRDHRLVKRAPSLHKSKRKSTIP